MIKIMKTRVKNRKMEKGMAGMAAEVSEGGGGLVEEGAMENRWIMPVAM